VEKPERLIVIKDAEIEDLQKRLAAKEKQQAELEVKYDKCLDLISALRRQIKETKDALELDNYPKLLDMKDKVQAETADRQTKLKARVKVAAAAPNEAKIGRLKLGAGVPPRGGALPVPVASRGKSGLEVGAMDVDGDGVLSQAELQSKMSIMGWSLEEAEKTFQAMDRDGDGSISAIEYAAFCHVEDKKLEFGTLDGIANLRQQLADLRAKLAAFASKDASKDAEIKDVKRRLVATEKQLAEEKRKEEEREANLKQNKVSAEKADHEHDDDDGPPDRDDGEDGDAGIATQDGGASSLNTNPLFQAALAAIAEAEAERRIEMCKRVVRRMLKHQLLMAWNTFVDRVHHAQHNRETVRKVLSRMQHRQLACVFECYARAVHTTLAQREMVAKTQADDRCSSIVCKVSNEDLCVQKRQMLCTLFGRLDRSVGVHMMVTAYVSMQLIGI